MFQTKVVAVTSQSCNLKQNVKTQLRRICVQLLEHIAVYLRVLGQSRPTAGKA